ncbi:MAG TPA: hypothetical protein VGB85_10265 [Nannocystis sp.]|jgi:hypothetical protein
MANIDRFLDAVRKMREVWAKRPEDEDEDEPTRPSPLGAEYQTLTSSLGLPCPPELVLLGDALADGRVFGDRWELNTPEGAVYTRKELQEWAIDSPCLRPRAQMLPLFGSDGDHLLLDRDGSIWPWSHEIPTDDEGCVARSLDEALGMMLDGPEIEFQRGYRWGFWSVDGIEYKYTVGHSCETDASSKKSRCETGVSIDLAPHVIRPPGDHHLRFGFPEPPPERPRTAPIGLVTTPRGVVDLRRLEVLTALLRIGRARGWTGRAGPLEMGDATPLLDEIP